MDFGKLHVAAFLNSGEHCAPALCPVIGKGRQWGCSCNQQRLFGKFAEQSGLQQAIFAATEGSSKAKPADGRARNVKLTADYRDAEVV
jgi:hypothetical protein